MRKNQKISVCIPTRNRANFLKKAIKSALRQDYDNFEIIVADDHSTDNTKEIVQSFNDNRLVYHFNKIPLGCYENQNYLLNMVKGEFVAFLHDDNIAHLKWLSAIGDVINNNPSVGVVAPLVRIFDNMGNLISEYSSGSRRPYDIWHGKDVLKDWLEHRKYRGKHNIVCFYPSIAINRKLAIDAGGFQGDTSEGLLINKILLLADYAQINEILFSLVFYHDLQKYKYITGDTSQILQCQINIIKETFKFAQQRRQAINTNLEKVLKIHAFKAASIHGIFPWLAVRAYPFNINKKIKAISDVWWKLIKMNLLILFNPLAYTTVVSSIILPPIWILNIGKKLDYILNKICKNNK